MSTANTARTLLKRARAKIARPYGWVRHTSRILYPKPRKGVKVAYCMTGALDYSNPGPRSKSVAPARALLERAIRELYPNYDYDCDVDVDVEGWNDFYAKDKRQVLRVFDRAIEMAEADKL